MVVAAGTRGLTEAAKHEITVHNDDERREARLCVAEGERLGLYDVIGETGPVTVFDLALDAKIPMSFALRWLASQTQIGVVVRDVVTGRYRTWCVLPDWEEGTG